MAVSSRTVTIPHLGRIEGHGGILVKIVNDVVHEVTMDIFEGSRYYEVLLRGKHFLEVQGIITRVCAICSASHTVAALGALEAALGVEQTPRVKSLRGLLVIGSTIESHALHVFALALPDFLGYDSVISMAKDYPTEVVFALRLKQLGNRLQEVVGGRAVHPVNTLVGGFGKVPSHTALAAVREELIAVRKPLRRFVDIAAGIKIPRWAAQRTVCAALRPHEEGYRFRGNTFCTSRGEEFPLGGYRDVVREPLGVISQKTYDGEGNLLTIKQASGTSSESTTNLAYDVLGRLQSVTDPMGYQTRYDYLGSTGCATCGGSTAIPAKITDPLNNVTLLTFDKNGRVIGMQDPLGNVTTATYDTAGRMTSRNDGNGKTTKYEDDSVGRIVKQTDATGESVVLTYDSRGNIASLTDQNGNTSTFSYDLADRMTRETRPLGQYIEYTYYPNGLIKTIRDPKGQVTTYKYDAADRSSEIVYADGKTETFTYDNVGNLLSYTKDGAITHGGALYNKVNRYMRRIWFLGSHRGYLPPRTPLEPVNRSHSIPAVALKAGR